MKRVLLFVTLLAAAAVLAQDQPTHRVVTMTRTMALFSDLEDKLDQALAAGDEATVNKMVKEDFNLWTPQPPGDPTPREDWLAAARKEAAAKPQRRQIAVQTFGDTNLFSYVRTDTAKHDLFMVDVWVKSGDSYQLAARYQAPLSNFPHTAPKPTGKE